MLLYKFYRHISLWPVDSPNRHMGFLTVVKEVINKPADYISSRYRIPIGFHRYHEH